MTGSGGRIFVSQETLNRDEVIRDFCAGRLTRSEAAGVLGKSERQVSRLVGRWRKKGVLGLEHGQVGKRAHNHLDSDLESRVIALLKNKYAGFNLKHFHEKLVEAEKVIGISYSSVKRLAREQGLARAQKRLVRKSANVARDFHRQVTCCKWTDPNTRGGKAKNAA